MRCSTTGSQRSPPPRIRTASVRPSDLRRQLKRLRTWGYEFVQFGEWAQRVWAGDAAGLVTLTFDDGYVDNLETLVPILAEEDATATVFVVSGWLGQPTPYPPERAS